MCHTQNSQNWPNYCRNSLQVETSYDHRKFRSLVAIRPLALSGFSLILKSLKRKTTLINFAFNPLCDYLLALIGNGSYSFFPIVSGNSRISIEPIRKMTETIIKARPMPKRDDRYPVAAGPRAVPIPPTE
jgi:hypothetical protein